MHRHTSPYTNYGVDDVTVDLTASWQTHELIFTAQNVTSPNGRLRFRFSSVDDFYLDNVSLAPVSARTAAGAHSAGAEQVYLPVVAGEARMMAAGVDASDGAAIPADGAGTEVYLPSVQIDKRNGVFGGSGNCG